MPTYFHNVYSNIIRSQYNIEKERLQVELLKLQQWAVKHNKRVALVFEGRDAAGKGSTIKRFTENMMPKHCRVVELGIPTEQESKSWFRRYEEQFPEPGEIVFFDRSWYTRALIEPTMGYCGEAQYKYFMSKVVKWEESFIKNGLILIKFYLSVTRENQMMRFDERKTSALKYWKYSENDEQSHQKWDIFTKFKEQMFQRTSSSLSPWIVINANQKMTARLNAMLYTINTIEYEAKMHFAPEFYDDKIYLYKLGRIHAAGGLVVNDRHQVLLIFKRGRWDLPKGRVEDFDRMHECAVREVEEETGLKTYNLEVIAELIPTYHVTQHNDIKYLKKTHWYLMRYKAAEYNFVPEVKEGIVHCEWINYWDLEPFMRQSNVPTRIVYLIDFWLKNYAYLHQGEASPVLPPPEKANGGEGPHT